MIPGTTKKLESLASYSEMKCSDLLEILVSLKYNRGHTKLRIQAKSSYSLTTEILRLLPGYTVCWWIKSHSESLSLGFGITENLFRYLAVPQEQHATSIQDTNGNANAALVVPELKSTKSF